MFPNLVEMTTLGFFFLKVRGALIGGLYQGKRTFGNHCRCGPWPRGWDLRALRFFRSRQAVGRSDAEPA